MKKQSGEVAENKESPQKTNRKQTENKPGQVVENTSGAKKQTENKPKNKAGYFIEDKDPSKNKPELNHQACGHTARLTTIYNRPSSMPLAPSIKPLTAPPVRPARAKSANRHSQLRETSLRKTHFVDNTLQYDGTLLTQKTSARIESQEVNHE